MVLTLAANLASAATPQPASAPSKPVRCAKGFDKMRVTALQKVEAPGYVGYSYAGKAGSGQAAETEGEFKAKGLAVGVEFCMKRESAD